MLRGRKSYSYKKMKFSVKYFFSKCDQIRKKLQIWSHSLKKSLMDNFISLCSDKYAEWYSRPCQTSICIIIIRYSPLRISPSTIQHNTKNVQDNLRGYNYISIISKYIYTYFFLKHGLSSQ